jgi:uncharacterized delta-60 repeat protein
MGFIRDNTNSFEVYLTDLGKQKFFEDGFKDSISYFSISDTDSNYTIFNPALNEIIPFEKMSEINVGDVVSFNTTNNSDGTIDNTFNIGGGFSSDVFSIALQPDGKILVGGGFSTYGSTTRNGIIRLNTGGTIDNTFNIGTGFTSNVLSIALQPDGKILAGGDFTSYSGVTSNRIIRLNSDGTIDNTFNIGTGFSSNVRKIVLQPDGKILAVGDFISYDGTNSNRIIRLDTGGTIDNTFNIGSGFDFPVYTIALQPDNKILVGGEFTSYSGVTSNRIIRLEQNGTIDGTFNIGTGFGTGFSSAVLSIVPQPDGRILVGGYFISYNGTSRNQFIRLEQNGTIDGTFNIGTGFNNTFSVYTIALQPDGKILVGGAFISYNGTSRNRIIRLEKNGTIDGTFNIGTGFTNNVQSIALQPDGKILVGGTFTSYNGTTRNRIIRLNSDLNIIIRYFRKIKDFNNYDEVPYFASTSTINTAYWEEVFPFDSTKINPQTIQILNHNGVKKTSLPLNISDQTIIDINNGTVDNTFNIGTGFTNNVQSIALQPDNKILVGGTFTSYNGTIRNRIIRLNSDGTIDNTFNIGTGFTSNVFSIALQPDGKILAGGEFTSYDGTTSNRIIRLEQNGVIDNTFNIVGGFGNIVYTIALQPDGKILVGGAFISYNGTSRNRIIRLNTDGTIDNTFNIGGGFTSFVYTIVPQPNGKILVGGDFTSYNSTARKGIIRLNSDGTIDNTFNIGGGFSSNVRTIALQPDGKILAGGEFTSYDGTTSNYIIRLNSDGTFDNTFDIGTGFGIGAGFPSVFSITLQLDGKILVGGVFDTYNGTTSNRIIRLNSDGTIDNTFNTGSGFGASANPFVSSIIQQPDNKILVGGNFDTYSGVTSNDIIRLNSTPDIVIIGTSKLNDIFTQTTLRGDIVDGLNYRNALFGIKNKIQKDYVMFEPDYNSDDTLSILTYTVNE